VSDKEQGEYHPKRNEFDSNIHLVFSPPKWISNLLDIDLNVNNTTSSFALSGDFLVFSATATKEMRKELLTNEVQQKF